MSLDKEGISTLRRIFNLNLYEVRLWSALLERGVSSAGELSNITEVPRSRTYDVLESLEKRGFIIVKMGKPIRYMAVPPSEVLERIQKEIMNRAQKKLEDIDRIKESPIFTSIQETYIKIKDSVDEEIYTAIKGRYNIYAKLSNLINNANESVVMITTENGLLRKTNELLGAFKKASEKGVKIDILAPVNEKNADIKQKLEKTINLININEVSARFAIIDSEDIILLTSSGENINPQNEVGLWVKSKYLGNSLNRMLQKISDYSTSKITD